MFNWQDLANPLSGGAEVHLHEVFGRLARRGHEVHVVASAWPGANSSEVADGMVIHRVGGRYTYGLAAPRYYRSVADAGWDVVVEDLNKVPLFTPWWVRAPLVLVVHHLFGGSAFGGADAAIAAATWLLERPIPRVYRGVPVQAVSPSTADDLRARGLRSDVEVIPNGVDVARFRPPGEGQPPPFERPTLAYVGRLRPYKGVDLMLRALAALRAEGIDARAIVAGKGDDEERLRRLAGSLGIAGAVDFEGFVDEDRKVEVMRRAWVHILASAKEGWGLTVLEAGAAGTPSVVSDAPGLRDSVVEDQTGLRVPHGDVPALAGALRRVIEDEPLRARLGRGAREFADRHGWDRAAEMTERHLARQLRKE